MADAPSQNTYESLHTAAAFHPDFRDKRKDETDQDYLHRLADAIGNVPDEQWNLLSEAAKQWYDSSLDDSNRLRPELTLPDGYQVAPPPAPPAPTRRRPASTPVTSPTPTLSVYDTALAAVRENDATFAPKHIRETDQVYLGRLLRSLPEDMNAIPKAIEAWVADADGAVNQSKPIPLPDGYLATDGKAAPEAPGKSSNGSTDQRHVDADGNPLTGIQLFNSRLAAGEVTRRKRATKQEMAERPVKVVTPREPGVKQRRHRKPSPDSTTALIRVALTNDPGMSVEDLQAMIKAAGKEVAVTTIASTRAAHLASLQIVQSLGWQPPLNTSAPGTEND